MELDDGRVLVEGDHLAARSGRQVGVGAHVGAQVPDGRATGRAQHPLDDLPLRGRRRLGVGGLAGIGQPVAANREMQVLHRASQAVQEGLVAGEVHRSGLGGFGNGSRGAGDLGLLRAPVGAGVEMEVGQQPAQPGPAGQQAGGQVQRQAVDELPEHQPAARVAMRHERERSEEVLAELPVRRPRGGQIGDLEREAVDEDRSPAVELHVVGRRIAQPHPGSQRAALNLQGQEGGLAQLGERPLVRIGDQGELARPNDERRAGDGREVARGLVMGHQQPVADQISGQPATARRPSSRRARPGRWRGTGCRRAGRRIRRDPGRRPDRSRPSVLRRVSTPGQDGRRQAPSVLSGRAGSGHQPSGPRQASTPRSGRRRAVGARIRRLCDGR